MERWLIYALGGGLGHLVRGLALARAAAVTGVRSRLLTNSPWAGRVPLEVEPVDEVVRLDPNADGQRVRARVEEEIGRGDYDVLVVDTFPRGLAGELADVAPPVPRVLVHRDLSPTYIERFPVHAAARTFDLVLAPGEAGPLAASALSTSPWLVRDAEELLDAAEARRRLDVAADDDRPVLGVVACGRASEAAEAAACAEALSTALTDRAVVRLFSLGTRDAYWPLLELLPGVDLVVGSGGYNTVYEARAAGVPLFAVPRSRLYDRQAHRLSAEENIDGESLVDYIASRVTRRGATRPSYVNGTHAAVAAIRGLSGLENR